jgi:hypothetical protein
LRTPAPADAASTSATVIAARSVAAFLIGRSVVPSRVVDKVPGVGDHLPHGMALPAKREDCSRSAAQHRQAERWRERGASRRQGLQTRGARYAEPSVFRGRGSRTRCSRSYAQARTRAK